MRCGSSRGCSRREEDRQRPLDPSRHPIDEWIAGRWSGLPTAADGVFGLGGLLYGADIGIIAAALLYLSKTVDLSLGATSLVVAVLGGSNVFVAGIGVPPIGWAQKNDDCERGDVPCQHHRHRHVARIHGSFWDVLQGMSAA